MKSKNTNALWSDEQVESLNSFQNDESFHPFTCPGEHDSCENKRNLVATNDGWICACGDYKQNWAHEFMLNWENKK